MFPKIVLLIVIFALLSACTAPPAANPAPTGTLPATLPPTASQTLIATFTATETLTPTPEPTATPELPTINLDINGDGVTDYVGSVKESQNIEIPEGEPARLDMIRIGTVTEYGDVLTHTQYGYLTGYDIVSISNGSREIDLVFLKVKYFRKDKQPVTAEFSFLKTLIDQYGFKGTDSLGKQISINLAAPAGSDFTERSKRKSKDVLNTLDFEFSVLYPEGAKWLKAEEIVKLLKNSDTDLDFKFETVPYYIDFRD